MEQEQYQGTAQFNMGVASMQRMDIIIRNITSYKTMLYLQGQPMHLLLLRLQKALYTELYPYLTTLEVDEANKHYLNVFETNPIISTGTSLIIPFITERKMDEFELWVMLKLREKGILQRFEEDPGEAIL